MVVEGGELLRKSLMKEERPQSQDYGHRFVIAVCRLGGARSDPGRGRAYKCWHQDWISAVGVEELDDFTPPAVKARAIRRVRPLGHATDIATSFGGHPGIDVGHVMNTILTSAPTCIRTSSKDGRSTWLTASPLSGKNHACRTEPRGPPPKIGS